MSATPYSDAWREHTKERMKRHRYSTLAIAEETGLPLRRVVQAIVGLDTEVSLEITEPIDELFRKRDAHPAPRRGEIVPVAVDLDVLTNLGASHPFDEQTHTITLGAEAWPR
jgi:hypothetical protein